MNTDTVLKIISMLEACAIWAVLYVIVYFTTNALGLKRDLPAQTKVELKDVTDAADLFIKILSDDKPDTQESLMGYLKRVIKTQKRAGKLFAVVNYDNPSSSSIQTAYDQIMKVTDLCKKISYLIGKNRFDDIIPVVEQIKVEVAEADRLLDVIIKEEEEKRYLNI